MTEAELRLFAMRHLEDVVSNINSGCYRSPSGNFDVDAICADVRERLGERSIQESIEAKKERR